MASFLEELKKSNPLQEGINKTGAGFQLPQMQPQVPQGQMQPQIQQVVPRVEAQAPEGKYGSMDLSSAANIDLGGGEFHSQFPATSPMLDPRRDTGSFAGTGSGIILDVPQNLPQNTSSGTGGFAGAEEVVSSVTPKPSPAADSSGVFDPARVDDVDPFSANTGVDRLPQQYLGDADTTGGVQPQTPQVQAPTDGLTTQSGIPLSQFLSGEAIPEAGLRAEAPVFSSESRGISGAAGQDIMAQASAEREARIDENFGRARGPDSRDRDRRMATGEGTSMADLTDMAKANARGASPRDVARGQKVADALGVDLKTGKPLETQDNGGMTAYQAATLAQKDRDFNYEVFKEQKGEVAAKAESQKRASLAASDAMRQNQNIMDTAREAGKNIGITTTGVGGALLGIIPGTGAFDQKSTVDTLQADAAFTALQNMRDSSPTGGALGQVSERELKLLSSNVRNLDHKQSPEQFRKNLAEYVKLRNQSMANMYRAYATDFSPEEANAAFGVGGIEDFGVAQSGGTSGIKNDRDVATTADSLLEKY